MYSARERIDNEEWIQELHAIAEHLDLDDDARSTAVDLFLSNAPDEERSKRAVVAASLYAGALIAGDARSQGEVATAADVSRLTVQQRWKDLLGEAGLEPPSW